MEEKTMLGDFIYERRKALNLSQSELGNLVGVSNKAVSKWETKEANPDLKIMKKLSEALECSVDELLSCEMKENNHVIKKIFGYTGRETKTKDRYEFISDKINKKGDPCLHINLGKGLSNINCKAKGSIAIGNISSGKLSIGLVSKGLFSIGLVSLGLISFGVLAISLLISLSAISISLLVSVGAISVGLVSIGAISIGVYSLGAVSIGVYAHTSDTGVAIGVHEYIHNINRGSNKK